MVRATPKAIVILPAANIADFVFPWLCYRGQPTARTFKSGVRLTTNISEFVAKSRWLLDLHFLGTTFESS